MFACRAMFRPNLMFAFHIVSGYEMKSFVVLLSGVLVASSLGCSESIKEFPCAAASGVVLCEGQPVRGAQVYFAPKADGKSAVVGKPAFSWTGEDGRFVLSTYGDGDGAVVGSHTVRVTTGTEFPCNCVGEETRDLMDVEVKEGEENEFEISLPKRTAPVQKSPFDDEEESE